ncbi:MAG: FAD:protein FMN transferase [Vicingaceae bacterium]
MLKWPLKVSGMKYLSKLCFILFSMYGCNQSDGMKTYNGEAQGTTFHIIYACEYDLEPEIDSVLELADVHFSTYRKGSMINRINKTSESAAVDDLFTELWEHCWDLNIRSNGYFDPSLAPVLALYDFDDISAMDLDSEMVKEALAHTGMHLMSVENGVARKKDSRFEMNMNAVAQGYTVDLIANFLSARKCSSYMVEIGGELRCKGKKKNGEEWVIGIDKPIQAGSRELFAKVSLMNASMATSGNYRKFKTINGSSVGHIINPKSGFPERSNILSISVIANECYEADAMATAFMNMAVEEVKAADGADPGIKLFMIYLEGMDTLHYQSPGLKAQLIP